MATGIFDVFTPFQQRFLFPFGSVNLV